MKNILITALIVAFTIWIGATYFQSSTTGFRPMIGGAQQEVETRVNGIDFSN